MHKELKNEFVEHSTLIFSSSVFDNTPKISTASKFLLLKCIFQHPARAEDFEFSVRSRADCSIHLAIGFALPLRPNGQ
jgi:hypothetical protein